MCGDGCPTRMFLEATIISLNFAKSLSESSPERQLAAANSAKGSLDALATTVPTMNVKITTLLRRVAYLNLDMCVNRFIANVSY